MRTPPAVLVLCLALVAEAQPRLPVPRTHPYLLGDGAALTALARSRPDDHARMVAVARKRGAGDHERMISLALAYATVGDLALGREAVRLAMAYVDGPLVVGHAPFGADLARCGLVYDLCHALWTDAQRGAFHVYLDRTIAANLESETHVFHNVRPGVRAVQARAVRATDRLRAAGHVRGVRPGDLDARRVSEDVAPAGGDGADG